MRCYIKTILTDEPISKQEDDILNRKGFVKNLGDSLISWNEETSLVIGLYGKWGFGKSSVINLTESANVTQNVTVKLTENQKKILELVKENPVILQEEIATKLGVARETVSRNMTKLQALNLLEHIGADKNGCWKVKN